LCPRVILLLRTLFLESQGRRELLQRYLARVHIFSDRNDHVWCQAAYPSLIEDWAAPAG
jgi:hypothetical protein